MKFTFEGDMHELAQFLGLLSADQRKTFMTGIVENAAPAEQEKRSTDEEDQGAKDEETDRAQLQHENGSKRTRATKAEMAARNAAKQAPAAEPAPAATQAPKIEEPTPAAAEASAEANGEITRDAVKSRLAALMGKKGGPAALNVLMNASGGKKNIGSLEPTQFAEVHAALEQAMAA